MHYAKCLPTLLYATEACPLLSRDKQSLEFTLTRLFMKVFRTASPAVVKECQRIFGFLPIMIRTAKFLQVFVATDNSLCQLFRCSAVDLLDDILRQYGVHAVGQLVNKVNDVFTAAAQ